ncbi:FadR/GntR family transcriptional regulator [Oerskovia sp. KBS0722]|uniref:FadR/GntR family transcriptional regulator n=1 Tax=Oerskovia sp. KBS0722 TaxID=1179673 RepID=UPI00110F3C05|nr:GntR family transcriptional regulator [Oerskovia sp. KBS0722]QDW63774.1 FadR family transcriptional regulator [Oerskovia sp. KBS0722]
MTATEPGGHLGFGGQGVRPPTTTEQIKEYILRAHLRPGDLLPTEAELCSLLGVSRSNVREAIRTLAALDIVEVRHGYGTYVGQLSLKPLVEGLVFRGVLIPGDDFSALREVVEVRQALDLSMAEQIVTEMAGTSNPDLESLVAAMERKAQKGEDFFEEDREFHSHLLAHLDNFLVAQLGTAFWDVHQVVSPKLGLPAPEQIDLTAKAHGAMLRAAEAGDADAYRAAVVAHYAPLQDALRHVAATVEAERAAAAATATGRGKRPAAAVEAGTA